MDPVVTAAAHYAALRRATLSRRWVAAAAIGAAIGLVTNLVLPWPVALVLAPVAMTVLLIWDRRHGVIADWWPGNRIPLRLAAVAARLERQGWTALPAPMQGHDSRRTAYLLIGPGGVFVVDHQVWWAPDRVTTHSGLVMVGGKPAARRVAAVKGAAAAVTQGLASHLPNDSMVHAVVAVDGPTLNRQFLVADVTMVPSADLMAFLRSREPALHPHDIAAVTTQARRFRTGI